MLELQLWHGSSTLLLFLPSFFFTSKKSKSSKQHETSLKLQTRTVSTFKQHGTSFSLVLLDDLAYILVKMAISPTFLRCVCDEHMPSFSEFTWYKNMIGNKALNFHFCVSSQFKSLPIVLSLRIVEVTWDSFGRSELQPYMKFCFA